MVSNLYCVYDLKVEVWHAPFCLKNDGHAIRHFTQMFNSERNMFNQFAEDFRIFMIGKYNDASGEIVGSNPVLLCEGTSLVQCDIKNDVESQKR